MNGLPGNNVLLTGGNSGIGQAFPTRLGVEGATPSMTFTWANRCRTSGRGNPVLPYEEGTARFVDRTGSVSRKIRT